MTENTPSKIYKKSFPSDPDLLPEIEDFIMDKVTEANLDKKKLSNLALSVAEATSNAIMHGNKADKDKNIFIEIHIFHDKVNIIIKDEGEGFSVADVPDPTQPENILKDSGRGIYIMRSFLDDLKFDFSSKGTTLTLSVNR